MPKMNPTIFVKLARAPVHPSPGFDTQTQILSHQHACHSDVLLGFVDETVVKSASVSGLFSSLDQESGTLTMELAVELFDLLPNVGGLSECVVSVQPTDRPERQICLSNRMSKFHFVKDAKPMHVLLPRQQNWHGQLPVGEKEAPFGMAYEEQLKTMASMRFDIAGPTAEAAFERHIRSAVDDLYEYLRHAVESVRLAHRESIGIGRVVQEETLPILYVLLCKGIKREFAQLGLDYSRVRLIPDELIGDSETRFRDLASGRSHADDVERLLSAARSSCSTGELEFAFLQCVIAAEMLTKRTVWSCCLAKGVSTVRLENTRRDMTYAWALGVGLPLVIEASRRPSPDLVNAMDSARRRRNGLMHEAQFAMQRNEVLKLIEQTESYVTALRIAVR